mmetsp:Transcript_38324/g.105565  ORF Transcript_38324/g.105565 Transcript_38324/m.105565 type:complete len:117 (+) Transcript_38324:88-438(+)
MGCLSSSLASKDAYEVSCSDEAQETPCRPPQPEPASAPGRPQGPTARTPVVEAVPPGADGQARGVEASRCPELAPGLWTDRDGDVAHEFWEEDRRSGTLCCIPREALLPVRNAKAH